MMSDKERERILITGNEGKWSINGGLTAQEAIAIPQHCYYCGDIATHVHIEDDLIVWLCGCKRVTVERQDPEYGTWYTANHPNPMFDGGA
jgi:hypothetical protein